MNLKTKFHPCFAFYSRHVYFKFSNRVIIPYISRH